MSVPMVFVQARMASARFPGKALAPLNGIPLIEHVLKQALIAVGRKRIVLCTTVLKSDDVLAGYVNELGVSVSRGEPDNVVRRLQVTLQRFPCDRFFRVCGDSPLIDPGLFARFLAVDGEPDLVTNTFPRTFPKGQSLELVRSATFAALDSGSLTAEQREHPTQVFYDHLEDYYTVGIHSNSPPGENVVVDTIEDLRRIEAML